MNKILIILLILGAGALIIYLLAGNTDNLPENIDIPDDVSVNEIEELLKDDGERIVRGSCNVVAEKSTCVDYIGSMWDDVNSAELNCGTSGSFSKNTCPYSEYGGCQTGMGTVTEIIMWYYKEGGGGFDDQNIQFAKMACENTGIAVWVTPETLLQ